MMVCDKCGNDNSKTAKFCIKCGAKVEARTTKETRKEKSAPVNVEDASPHSRKKFIILSLIAAGASIFLLMLFTGYFGTRFTPEVVSAYAVDNSPDCKEVPYQVEEPYTEQVPYTDYESRDVSLKYVVTDNQLWETYDGFNVVEKAKVTVRNMDTESGLFSVKYTFTTLDGNYDDWQSINIYSGDIEDFNFVFDKSSGQDVRGSYIVSPGTKTITEPVTKYRTVTNYRTVTKYRTECQ